MEKISLSGLLFIIFIACPAQAQQLHVSLIDFGTGVQNRNLAGSDTAFANTIGTVYCYTEVKGADSVQEVIHVWYYKDQQKARIVLPVESSNWRTWSSKTIREDWTGPWRVMIEDGNGNILATKTFIVESSK